MSDWSQVPLTQIQRMRAGERRDEMVAAGEFRLENPEARSLDEWLSRWSKAAERGPLPFGDEIEPGTSPGTGESAAVGPLSEGRGDPDE